MSSRLVCMELRLARPAGLEPATSGLEKLDRELSADSTALQPNVTVQVGPPRRVHRSQRVARSSSRLVTTLLQAAAKRLRIPRLGNKESTDLGLTGEVYLMSVKEVAKALRVCTATVYDMVDTGELAHVRVSNAIRVVVRCAEIGTSERG
ncbi:MAG TPA: helix-turn-helix domain-containing protein [Polyangiaceae bacterium]